nr:MAG: capsid protein [Chemarfal virus 46]
MIQLITTKFPLFYMSFKLHGNYCGPGWSAGKWQESVSAGPRPVDAVDWACARHDAAYAQGKDRYHADLRFARDTFATFTPLGIAAGLGVGAQGLLRGVGLLSRGGDNLHGKTKQRINHSQSTNNKQSINSTMARGRIQRGIQAKSRLAEIQLSRTRYPPSDDKAAIAELKAAVGNLKKKVAGPVNRFRNRNRVAADAIVSTAPVSIGTTIVASRPTVVNTTAGVKVGGREFMANVNIRGNSSWQIGAIAPVHPMYYIGSVLSNTARSFQYYKVHSLRVHFVTRQATSLAGEVIMTYAANALEPAEDGNSAAFISRAMTRGHATLGPLWQNLTMDVPCDGQFRLVDAFNASTFAQNVAGEVQVYTQTAASNDTAGYLIMDYVVEFKDTMFSPHSTSLPWATAASTFELGVVPILASGAALYVGSSLAAASLNGTIFKMVVDVDQSTFGTGTTAVNAFSTALRFNSSLGTSTSAVTNFTVQDGLTLYGLVSGTQFYVYTSYDAAVNGEGSGQVFANLASTTAGVLAYSAYAVRLADKTLIASS